MPSHRSGTTAADKQLVNAAHQVVHERLWMASRELTLEDVSNACGVSPRRLQRAFYRESPVGRPTSFQQMVTGERMLAARRMLRSRRGISVREAARRVGYRDVPQFTRAYRDRFGVTPAADRHAAGGRERGGRPGGAAVSGRARRERLRRRALEAEYLEADLVSTATVFDLTDEESHRARGIATERGVAAMHRWVRGLHAARLNAEAAEWRAQMAMLETSVILRRAELLNLPVNEVLEGAESGEGA